MNKIPVRPIRDRVVCLQLSSSGKEKKTNSGIILPTGRDGEDNIRAEVMAVGLGAITEAGVRVPPEVVVGDVVVFQKGLEEEIVVKGEGGSHFSTHLQGMVIDFRA